MVANNSYFPAGTWVRAKRSGGKRYVTRQTNEKCFEDDGKVSGQAASTKCHYNDYEKLEEDNIIKVKEVKDVNLFGPSEKEMERIFEDGRIVGMEEGIRKGMSMNFERSDELSPEEYREAIDFLTTRGLELCCYDVHRGGFRIRKRRYHE